jgi:hypothetical protein
LARDAAVEKWLQNEVAQSYDSFVAGPNSGIPLDNVMERLRTSYKERAANAKK